MTQESQEAGWSSWTHSTEKENISRSSSVLELLSRVPWQAPASRGQCPLRDMPNSWAASFLPGPWGLFVQTCRPLAKSWIFQLSSQESQEMGNKAARSQITGKQSLTEKAGIHEQTLLYLV